MKDIGQSFKETRETVGISEEEAANDMGISVAQLENLEDGNANAFKDVFFLKELIRKYAKYLNLDEDKLIDEYNEFMFNFTSRIPISEIEKKVEKINKEENKEQVKKIASPYTIVKETKNKLPKIFIYIIVVFLVIIVSILVVLLIKNKVNNENFVGINIMMKGNNYEFTE